MKMKKNGKGERTLSQSANEKHQNKVFHFRLESVNAHLNIGVARVGRLSGAVTPPGGGSTSARHRARSPGGPVTDCTIVIPI